MQKDIHELYKKNTTTFTKLHSVFTNCLWGGNSDPLSNNNLDELGKSDNKTKVTIAQALLGPLSEASFKIKKLNSDDIIAEGNTTKGNGTDISTAGLIQVTQSVRDALASGLYIVEVSGGTDIDADDDKVWDTTPTVNQGTLHSVMNDTALKAGNFKVNVLTEIIYQDVKDSLANSTQQQIEGKIEQRAQNLLKDSSNGGDIDGDGDIDSDDIIAWNPADDQGRLRKDYDTEIKPIIEQIYDNLDSSGKVKILFNTAPTATTQSVRVDKNTNITITLLGTDPQDDALTFIVLTNPTHGTFNGTTYTPTANYNGTDSFTFKVNDGALDSAPVTVAITVVDTAQPNTAPTAIAQSVTMDEDTTKTITLGGTDPEGDALSYNVVTQPNHGTYNGTTYTPTANYNGSDSFSFTANDGSLTSAPATVTITINDVVEPNIAPVATAQSVTLDEDTSKTITLSGTDADGDNLTFSVVTPPSHGSFNGTTYTPTANYSGVDSFTFKASDGVLYSAPAMVSITIIDIAEPNQTPTATAQTITMDEDTSKTITLSATDPDGDNLTYTVTTQPSHGTYNGTTYTPTANYNGSDSFSFTASDASATSTPATINITINDIAEPDTTPPNTPTLTANPPTQITDSSITVEVNGEAGAKVFVGSTQKATIAANGKVSVTLTLSMGNNDFDITLKDAQNNESGILTISVEREEPQAPILANMALDISLNLVTVTHGTYTFELRTSGTAPTTTAQSAMSAWGKSSGTGNDTIILEVHDGYASGTNFQVVVKGASGAVVGQSDVFSFSGGSTDKGYGTIVLSE